MRLVPQSPPAAMVRRRLIGATLALGALLAFGPAAVMAASASPATVAVFDLELVDTSLQAEIEGPQAADLARLDLITDELRRRLQRSGRYQVIDVAPAAAEIEAAGYLRSCNGCELDIAEGLGAELALIGWVQKVSNLILNINLQIRDVASGELVFGASVDIRGNTDEGWLHGIRYLLKNRLLKE
jgi:Protein of unknown function (DUF2380)